MPPDSLTITNYVFAYGSLLQDLSGPQGEGMWPCKLRGHGRVWNVAMDNSLSLPGYKYYLDADGSRPPVFVTFLDIVPRPRSYVSGVLFAVDDDQLAALDGRERNYDRREVTGLIDAPVDGRAWSYFGKREARQRFALAAREGRAVIDRGYLDAVRAGFRLVAQDALEQFNATTDPHGCPVLDLRRIELA